MPPSMVRGFGGKRLGSGIGVLLDGSGPAGADAEVMKKTLSFTIALAALLACAASASAAKPVKYQGKTSGGHKVTFKLVKGKKVVQFVTATPTQCIAIQGGGAPISGADLWNPPIYFLVNHDNLKWQGMAKPAFHYNEVTKNYEVSSKKLRSGTIRGRSASSTPSWSRSIRSVPS